MLDYETLGEHLPPAANWWAMTENGEVNWHFNKPSMVNSRWSDGSGCCGPVSGVLFTNLPADWKTSLRAVKKPWRYPLADASTPVDAKVWVKINPKEWHKRHYTGDYSSWVDGRTSWTTSSKHLGRLCYGIVLPDPDHPDAPPPSDWRPT